MGFSKNLTFLSGRKIWILDLFVRKKSGLAQNWCPYLVIVAGLHPFLVVKISHGYFRSCEELIFPQLERKCPGKNQASSQNFQNLSGKNQAYYQGSAVSSICCP
jgi:hypothetical protein